MRGQAADVRTRKTRAAQQAHGEFRKDFDARELADAFQVFTSGMAATSKRGTTKARSKRRAGFAIAMLASDKR